MLPSITLDVLTTDQNTDRKNSVESNPENVFCKDSDNQMCMTSSYFTKTQLINYGILKHSFYLCFINIITYFFVLPIDVIFSDQYIFSNIYSF